MRNNEQDYRVRECIHRAAGAAGNYYGGRTYVKHLQRLPSDAAPFRPTHAYRHPRRPGETWQPRRGG